MLDDRRNAVAKAFVAASPEDLAKPNPIARLVAVLPTIGHLALFGLISHESQHLGQLATWRRAAGMPMATSKLPG